MSLPDKPFLSSASLDEIRSFVCSIGQPAYRAGQIADWVFRKWELVPERMLNIPRPLRDGLAGGFICDSSSISDEHSSPDGTCKLLLELRDREKIETVLIPSPKRTTFCLSTQVGCPVQCRFCASGVTGLVRNLNSGEIVEQFFHACRRRGSLPDNVVFMGIGEGLLNFQNLVTALDILCDQERVGLAARRVTVSTSGWTEGIRKLADLGRQWHLALSLHAPDDETRAKLIPDKFRRPVDELVSACEYYLEKTGRIVTFEYTLLAGVNDSLRHAAKLAELTRRARSKVNLIPYNETVAGFSRPLPQVVRAFQSELEKWQVPVTLRVEKGSGIRAACGQLRSESAKRQSLEK